MANFVATQPDLTWVDGYVPPAADYADLDAKVFAALNGDRGGTWAPSSAIVIAGSGLQVVGPARVAYGGSLRTTDGSRFVLGDGDWPLFGEGHAQRSRVILQPLHRKTVFADFGVPGVTLPSAINAHGGWRLSANGNGLQSLALGIQEPGKSLLSRPNNVRMALEVHDSATLSKVVLCFRVPSPRVTAPVTLPRFRVLRQDASGRLAPLKSTATDALGFTADANGWISPAPVASGSAWYANGAAQRLTYLCDQNNVIDVSQYVYWIELGEEAASPYAVPSASIDGITIRERKSDVVTASTGNIASLSGTMTVGGIALTGGERVLVKDQTQPYQNGIWIVNAGGNWTRATDFDTPDKVTPGCFVKVAEQPTPTAVSGTFWEIREPRPALIAFVVGLPLYFGSLTGVGNVYHSIKSYFGNIADMRWP
ncbi:MAG: hypothetical protein JST00_31670 [Deltaproteobacteria bacterium]|nr:hypothetical protein [Deltaproteobacteria bacterium]